MRVRASICCPAAGILAGAMLLASGCAMQSYDPRPLDAATSAQSFAARTTEAPELQRYMLTHGHPESDWPVQRWGLTQLTLLAFYYHPDLKVARAEAVVAKAETAVAIQLPPLGVSPQVQHHSLQPADMTSPWSVGVGVEIPIVAPSRREAVRDRYRDLSDAASLRVGATAWQVRAHVRDRLLDLYAAQASGERLEAEAAARRELVRLLERRLERGAASSAEVTEARVRLAQLEVELQTVRSSGEQRRAELAQAVGLPLEAVRPLELDFAVFERTVPAPDVEQMQRSALLNRLDVRAKLLEYAAEDAAVKLEIARQYPSFTLTPGYLWDQGDNIWSLAANIVLPPALGNRAGIQAAEARRELAAQQFLQLQTKAISDADTARTRYLAAAGGVERGAALVELERRRRERARKQFDAGYADRVELASVELESAAALRLALGLQLEAQRTLSRLEDALQIPLIGGPQPEAAELSSATTARADEPSHR